MSAEKKAIEEMAQVLETAKIKALATIGSLNNGFGEWHAKAIYEEGYRKIPEGAVVLTREEYEKLKSLYDCQQGAYMTSSIGDIPLTIEGLRKVVDEISRLNIVQAELQKLNANYYNEAKDLRRKLDKARRETAREILSEMFKQIKGYENVDIILSRIAKQYGVEVE